VTRGLVVPLSPAQVVARALYLAGKVDSSAIDEHVRGAATWCPDLYYLLKDYNGGHDPTAPDPATRWRKPGSIFENRTVDCSGGNAWMHGFDRFQPRFPLFRDRVGGRDGGWINCDSKWLDAAGDASCFESVGRPEPGTMIVCRSGTPGHKIGHEGTVVAYRGAEWDPAVRECWLMIDVVDCAARGTSRSNKMTSGSGWFGTDALFIRSTMSP
jgi:hypothetical protein